MVLEKNGKNQLDQSVSNEEALHRVNEDMNIIHTSKKKKKLNGLVSFCVGTVS